MLLERPELEAARKALGLGADSVILLINTEGDTDPVSYRNIVVAGRIRCRKSNNRVIEGTVHVQCQ